VNQANFLLGYEGLTMINVLVTTKNKSLGTNSNQENWMLVIWRLFVDGLLDHNSRMEKGLTFFGQKFGNFNHSGL
jgi:hypothetical protein